jgi:FAD/FMN-containing dehydrogenase
MSPLSSLRDLLGDAHVLTDADLKASYETDWTRRYHGSALAVARPGSVEEVVGVVRACADAGVAIVPQGGNTGLVGGSVPRDGELILSLTRLRSLGEVGAAGEVSVGAGIRLAELQSHAAAAGWDFGVDLGARDSATIGGMIATNAGGLHLLRHGGMRQQLLGIEAVLADGSVVRRMSGLRKDNTGYDLAGMLCGSEGTLGIITAARLRLVPPLPRRSVALLGLGSVAEAIALVDAARRGLPTLLAAELFFENGLSLVLDHTGTARPLAGEQAAYLLLEVADRDDPTDDLVAFLGDRDDVLLATDEPGRRRLWELRERHTEAIAAAGIVHKLDVSVPPARLAEFIERVGPTLEAAVPGALLILYGHIAEANLHVNVLGPAADDQRPDEAVLSLVVEMGGSVSAEHGVGVAKAAWLERDRGAADVAAMRAIKNALDPRGMLNPGVILSDG